MSFDLHQQGCPLEGRGESGQTFTALLSGRTSSAAVNRPVFWVILSVVLLYTHSSSGQPSIIFEPVPGTAVPGRFGLIH